MSKTAYMIGIAICTMQNLAYRVFIQLSFVHHIDLGITR